MSKKPKKALSEREKARRKAAADAANAAAHEPLCRQVKLARNGVGVRDLFDADVDFHDAIASTLSVQM
jgi:hypothetical protein